MVKSGVPKDGVELKLKGVKLGDGEKEAVHNICLEESAFTLFLQGVIAALCLFVPFYQGVVSADVLILIDGMHCVFVNALLNKVCDHIHLTEDFHIRYKWQCCP